VTPATQKPKLRQVLKFEREELPRLFGVLGTVVFLHVLGWGLFIHFNSNPQYHQITDGSGALIYAGAGALAYGFGLRHAFDADHIVAIDDTTRIMLAKGKKPLGVGLFFSLGHSTVVLALSVGIAFAATKTTIFKDAFSSTGGTIGTSVSGFFLYLVGILNLVIMVGVVKAWKQAKSGKYSHEHLEQLLNDRSLMRRIFRGRFKKGFDHSWQLYPVGVLFGLGFDTATEVGLLALSATAAAGTVGSTFMTKAYSWAFTSPLRKIYYNLTTTGLSVFVALGIGTIQWISVASDNFGLAETQPFKRITAIDLSSIGYFIVLSFVLAFALSIIIWKIGKYEERFGAKIKDIDHTHTGLHIG